MNLKYLPFVLHLIQFISSRYCSFYYGDVFTSLVKYIPKYFIVFFKCSFLKDFIYLFLERGAGKEEERERNISVWLLLAQPQLGTWPATQACAQTGNRTGDPLVHRPALNPLNYLSQGYFIVFDAIVNGIVFFISFSDVLLLVYRNVTNIWTLILYPATLWNLLINSNSVLLFLGFLYMK